MTQLKKELKQTKKQLEEIFTKKLLIIVLIFLLVYVVSNIAKSIHNIDTAYNIINLGDKLNVTLTDTMSDFVERSPEQIYIYSMNHLIKYIGMAVLLSLLLGYLVGQK